jgi:hypothetical protein
LRPYKSYNAAPSLLISFFSDEEKKVYNTDGHQSHFQEEEEVQEGGDGGPFPFSSHWRKSSRKLSTKTKN